MEKEHDHNHHKHEDHHDHHKHEDHHHDPNGGHDHDGHDHAAMIADFKKRFFFSVVFAVPIILLSPMIQEWFGYTFDFPGRGIVLFVLASAVFFYGGLPFLQGAVREVKSKNPGMMTLIAMAITVAYLYSAATLFFLVGDDFFWELATLIVVMLLGHMIEMRSIMSAERALEELAELIPDIAERIVEGEIEEVPVEELEENDVVLVRPGGRIPADGRVVRGFTHVDESMLTGESAPVAKQTGDRLIGGAINKEGSIEVKVSAVQEDSYLAKVIDIVEAARKDKSKTQNITDKAARWLTFIALGGGFLTLSIWLAITGDATFAIARMATVMVIACPHALGLATPLVVANSTALAAKNGLLIQNRTAFERSRKVDVVVFDKTGTLTEGVFGVKDVIVTAEEMSEDDCLRIAATIEGASEHPIAKSIVEKAKEKGVTPGKVENFRALKGEGVEGDFDGESYAVLSKKAVEKRDITIPEESTSVQGSEAYLINGDKLLAVFILGDSIRKTSPQAVTKLKERGIKVYMLTGDNETTAARVAEELALDGYFAEVLPDEKEGKIKELQSRGHTVAMTGDGINDAPALARADVGIAIGSGTDVAAETADIILVESDPLDVVALLNLGRRSFRKMVQNLFWASGYNLIALPVAAGVLYGIGIVLEPAAGAVLMSLSTVIVAINAQLLKRKGVAT